MLFIIFIILFNKILLHFCMSLIQSFYFWSWNIFIEYSVIIALVWLNLLIILNLLRCYSLFIRNIFYISSILFFFSFSIINTILTPLFWTTLAYNQLCLIKFDWHFLLSFLLIFDIILYYIISGIVFKILSE